MKPNIDNRLYDNQTDAWWDENGLLHLLKVMVNPWRVPYFIEAMHDRFGPDLNRVRLLDAGCGGGVLSEEFARAGCRVTGVDVADHALEAARRHARSVGLSIDYRHADAGQLPFEADSFEVVACCDVLEHITDWRRVIAEAGRVLAPGGLFLFDTINRTPQSRVNFIHGLQESPLTRLFPPDTHVWDMFITPAELADAIEGSGMHLDGLAGSRIGCPPLRTLWEVIRHKQGRTTVAELGRRLELRLDPDLSLNYLGRAGKPA
jgi:2-polyprenyl-6-hydroxyphenyl methylase/3-demethylubiquinone-9 3-methyltransferase